MKAVRGIVAATLLATAGACGGGGATGGGKDAGPIEAGLPDGGLPETGAPDGGDASPGGYTLPDPDPPRVKYDGKVVITPGALLFVSAGETAQLTAAAFDAADAPVSGPVTWTSSRPDQVMVDASGMVTGVVALGSAQITAQIGTRVSAPILVAIVAPYPGTQRVTDAQILSGPDLVDPTAPIQPGVQMTTKVTGVPALQPGTIVVAKEGKHLAGRVVSVTAGADGQTVVLETVALLDLFQKMDIRTDTLIDEAALVAVEHAAQPPPPSAANDPGYGFTQTQSALLGNSFVCELSVGTTGLLTLAANARIVPALHAIAEFQKNDEGDWDVLHAEVNGTITATGSVTAKLAVGAQIQGFCDLLLGEIPVPMDGPIALFASAEIPFGIAGRFKAQLGAGNFQLGLEVTSTGHAAEGFYYTRATGLLPIHDQGIDFNMKPKVSFPATLVPVTTTVEIALGAFSGLDFRVLTEHWGLLRVLFLGKATGDFALVDTQLGDTAYASKYSIVPVLEAGPGRTVAKVLSWFGGRVQLRPSISVELSQFAAKSPAGKLTTPKDKVHPGDNVPLTVTLDADKIKFVGVDNVQRVYIYRSAPGTIARKVETEIEASPGQTEFTWTWHPGTSDLGANKFWATVLTTLGFGIELEIADDSTLPITVKNPGGWSGVVGWTLTGNNYTTNGMYMDTWTVTGDGMMNVTTDLSGLGTINAVTSNFHYTYGEQFNTSYADGTCMHVTTQTTEENLDGTSTDATSASFYIVDNGNGTATILAGTPSGTTSGHITVTGNDAASGTGLNCASKMTVTDDPSTGSLPGEVFMFTSPIAAGVVSGTGPFQVTGSQPPRDYTVTWSLAKD